MSLPVPEDDSTKEGEVPNQALEKFDTSTASGKAGADNDQNEPSKMKPDFKVKPDVAAGISAEARRLVAEEKHHAPHGVGQADHLSENPSSSGPGIVFASDVRNQDSPQPGTNAATTAVSSKPGLDKDTIKTCSDQPCDGKSSYRSFTHIVSPSEADESSNLALEAAGTAHAKEQQSTLSKTEENDSQSEIQSILEQFDEQNYGSETQDQSSKHTKGAENAFSTSLEHPPRSSSLDERPKRSPTLETSLLKTSISPASSHIPITEAPPEGDISANSTNTLAKRSSYASSTAPSGQAFGSPLSLKSPMLLHKTLPPAPDPEPDLPFDFHRFLDQLRHRTADPVAKFLRSFLVEFGKKQWMVHEQVKIISDFQLFITNKMAQCEVWRDVSDAEFDNAKEGMEKLVMNRLYTQTFSPAIPPPASAIAIKSKAKGLEKPIVTGRQGQHQEDIERDDVLAQKVQIYGWVKEEHLDIPQVDERGRRFLNLARQELIKIKSYRAPRDKVICILNCCKVIFGLLRDSKSGDTSADSFVPLLILVVLQANPDHLVSNSQYIMRFRNQDKLAGEAGYYLSSLTGAIQFIENLDRTALTVTDVEFEANVEAAVSAIAEKHEEVKPISVNNMVKPPSAMFTALSEKAEPSRPELSPRNSLDTEWHPQRSSDGVNSSEDTSEDIAAVVGLLRTIKKPLSSIGRIFSEDANTRSSLHSQQNVRLQGVQANTPPETPRRLLPAVFQPPRSASNQGRTPRDGGTKEHSKSPGLTASEAAARQASAEAAEARRIQQAEHKDVVETLAGMFPGLDRDIIDDVVREKQGRVGSAVDACLALSS